MEKRGYIISAQNTAKTDYIKCAYALALSLRTVMPDANITLLTDDITKVPEATAKIFNHVLELPHGDLAPDSTWKLINDYQVYEASPYKETIKLEADMLIPRSIEHWWDVLGIQDVVVSTTIRDFKGEISDCRVYRKFIDDNLLPDVYNAITYFRKSPTAEKFFAIVRDVFENWSQYKFTLKCNPQEQCSTDWAYAIAAHIVGQDKTTLPKFTEMSMTHMKQYVNGLPSEDWTDVLVYELTTDVLRVHTRPQLYPFHYHVKSFADTIVERYTNV